MSTGAGGGLPGGAGVVGGPAVGMSGMPSPATVVVVDPGVVDDATGVVVDVDPAVVDVVGVVSGAEVSGAEVSGTVVVAVPVVVVVDDGVVVTVVELDGSVVVDVVSAVATPTVPEAAVRVSAAVATTKKVTRRGAR